MLDFNNVTPLEDANAKRQRIEQALKADIRNVVRHLFPKATIGARDARVGDVHGTAGKSLAIALTPNEAGMWFDHANPSDKGDVFSLWGEALGLTSFADILKECDAYLGNVSTPRQVGHAQKQKTLPDAPKESKTLVASWVYRDKFKKKIVTVHRYDYGQGKKSFAFEQPGDKWSAPVPRPLYRLPDIHALEHVVLVEGEKCADALASVGIEATTAMGGCSAPLDKTDWTPLAGKSVILWPDNDTPGLEYMGRVCELLQGLGCEARILDVSARPKKWDAADAVEAGEDVRALLDAPDTTSVRPFKLYSIDELEAREPPEFLVDGFLTENGLSVLYGQSGTFKTFIALDMALSVAFGVEWRGKPVKPGCVVYICGEGQGDFGSRVRVWREARGTSECAGFWTLLSSLDMTDAEELKRLSTAISELPQRPSLIVIDTLARNFGRADENSTQDMNRFVSACDALRMATGAHVQIIHHSGKDKDKGSRGSSVLRAALDTEIMIDRVSDIAKDVRVVTTKQKSCDQHAPVDLTLVSAKSTHPATGEVISSLIPTLRTAPIVNPEHGESRRLGRNERRILEYLETWPDGMTFGELHKMMGIDKGNFARSLRSLESDNLLEKLNVTPAIYRIPKNTGEFEQTPPNDT